MEYIAISMLHDFLNNLDFDLLTIILTALHMVDWNFDEVVCQ